MNPDIHKKYESYPDHIRSKMLHLRGLILEVATNEDGVGELEETLKWGEPSYLTTTSKSGTTIRIDWKSKYPEQYAMYFNCKTTLIDTCRSLFPELVYEGNRAIIFNLHQEFPENEVRRCIALALNYHVDKNHGKAKIAKSAPTAG